MLITALTGGIATGKSIVSQVFKELGCYIHKADETAHSLMLPGFPAYAKVIAHFGPDILKADRTIDRQKLGRIVFSDPDELQFLNSIIHPLVMTEKNEAIEKVRNQGKHKIFLSEAALTIESGYIDLFDKIVITHCQQDIQIKRLMERDRIKENEALQKIQSQMPLEEKKGYADYLIDTSGSFQHTIEQTERTYRYLLQDHKIKEDSRRKDRS